MQKTDLTRLGIIALILAWCFDQLFWKKAPGISIFLFVFLCLGAGLFLTWREGLRPRPASLLLLLPTLFFALMTFFRQEPLTVFASTGLALAGLLALSLTWLGGGWWRYSLVDYVQNLFRWVGLTLAKPVQLYYASHLSPAERPGSGGSEEASPLKTGRSYRPALSVLFGLLLALPVVSLFALLLAEADPIFSARMQGLFHLFDLERLDEYIFRLVYISIGAYLLAGVYLYALLSSSNEKISGNEKPALPPFLGWLEAITLLACVDLLFGFFVAIQFRYFFGGNANIAVEGFTYAEYARRGFGELVAVAMISLLLFLSLSAVTRREGERSRRAFSALGIVLVALVAVMLVSAFQRLLLYESAYGFSRIRTYTHIFMIWLGILLLATVVLEGFGRLRFFALAAVLAGLGFGLTLNLINVDGLIVRQNVARADQGTPLDRGYLVSLSNDAVPVLFELLASERLSQPLRDEVGAALACRFALMEEYDNVYPWPSFHWSRERAARYYQTHREDLVAYPVRLVSGAWQVKTGQGEVTCLDQSQLFD